MTRDELARVLSQTTTASTSDLDVLDEREFEVFSLLTQGCGASQAKLECGIEPAEFRELKARIQKKLGLKDEVALMRRAAREANP